MVELERYNNKENIKIAKGILRTVLDEVRNSLKTKKGKSKLTFDFSLVGSGKHEMIYVPKEKQSDPNANKFDIDVQIVFQKYNNTIIAKNISLIDKATNLFLQFLNEKMFLHSFQNSGSGHRIQRYYSYNHKYDFCYEILFIVKEITKLKDVKNEQWQEIVENQDPKNMIVRSGPKTFILNTSQIYQDPLKRMQKVDKNLLSIEYKKLREEAFDKKPKEPNFSLLNKAIDKVISNSLLKKQNVQIYC